MMRSQRHRLKVFAYWNPVCAIRTVLCMVPARNTCFAIGIDPATVTSPTFGLIHLHDTTDGSLRIVHADMYRLSDVSELHELGWEDAIAVAPGCRCWAFVEWPQRIGPALPAERLNISLTITGETSRRLTLTGVGDQYTTIPQAFLERPTCD